MAARFSLDRAGVRAIGEHIADKVDEFGEEVLGNMVRLVPTDTTALLESLIVEREGEGALRINFIGIDSTFSAYGRHPADYGSLVNEGTSIMEPQPFIEPALYQAMKR